MSLEILAFDPGGTSGWAWILARPGQTLPDYFDAGQITGSSNEQACEIVNLLEQYRNAKVVCEAFHLRTLAAELSPVVLGSIIEWEAYKDGRATHYQQPSLAKSTITNERLRRWGLWVAGDHARDGMRHAVTFLRRTHLEPELLK